MTKKTTKRALLMSALSLVLCLSMLIGTTFAWFTDSVTSGNNKIVAGNLDVDLQVDVEGEWKSVTELEDDALFAVDLWEPGVVAYETFKAINVGNLALKYNMYLSFSDANTVTVDGEDYSLANVIKVAVIEGAEFDKDDRTALITSIEEWEAFTNNTTKVVDEVTLEAAESEEESADVYTVVAYWAPSNNDNIYNLNNGKTSSDGAPLHINFSVTLAATQATVEEDSFDKFYDEDATLSGPEAMESVINQGAKDANAAIADAIKAILEEAGDASWAQGIDPDSMIVYFDEEGLQPGDNGELTITLNFDGEDSVQFVDVAYTAVKTLIGNAVDAQAGNIYSITIAERAETQLVMNGKSDGADAIAEWVEKELKELSRAVAGGSIQGALEAAIEFGIPVEIIDMEGNAQVYRMNFALGWL